MEQESEKKSGDEFCTSRRGSLQPVDKIAGRVALTGHAVPAGRAERKKERKKERKRRGKGYMFDNFGRHLGDILDHCGRHFGRHLGEILE